MLPHPTTPDTYSPKRHRGDDVENQPLLQSESGGASSGCARKKRKYYSETEKLSIVLTLMHDELRWTLGDFLERVFAFGNDIHRTPMHAGFVQSFLKGTTNITAGKILALWIRHPDGRGAVDADHMYSVDAPYAEAKSVRVALTSFAVQTVKVKMVKEAETAIKPEHGLHTSRKRKRGNSESPTTVEWTDIGAATMARASKVIRTHQPVTQSLLLHMAERPKNSESSNQVVAIRRYRPAEVVTNNVISTLNFSRSNRANLLPLAHGILYFALFAPFDLYHYNSRIGTMTSYNTVYKTMEGLAKQEAAVVLELGKDTTVVKCGVIDNVQHYALQRDARVGRENHMNIGIAATYIEAPSCPVAALDVDDKRRRLAEDRRRTLTVDQLLGFVDMEHRETVGVLQWMRVLTAFVPLLSSLQAEVSHAYRTRAKKLPLPATPAKVHPLATSGKNETITTELKDALVDFMEQTGQCQGSYNRQLMLIAGDGLTFEKMVLLKHYMQFHNDSFESFDLIQLSLHLGILPGQISVASLVATMDHKSRRIRLLLAMGQLRLGGGHPQA